MGHGDQCLCLGCGAGSQHEGYCYSLECPDLQLDEEVVSTKVVCELNFDSLSLSLSLCLFPSLSCSLSPSRTGVYTKGALFLQLLSPTLCQLSGTASTLAITSPSSFLASRQKQQEKYYTASLIIL